MTFRSARTATTLACLACLSVAVASCGGGGDTGDEARNPAGLDGAPSEDAPGTTPETTSDTTADTVIDAATDADPDADPDAMTPDDGSPFELDTAAGQGDDVADLDPPATGEPTEQGDTDPDDALPVGASDSASIAGFWDLTRETERGTDVLYALIADDGGVLEYDFRGDAAAGTAEDCHAVRSVRIASRGEGRFDIQDDSSLPGSDSVDDVRIVIEGDALVFRYIGDVFDPAFGEGQSGITERFGPVANASPDTLRVCDG